MQKRSNEVIEEIKNKIAEFVLTVFAGENEEDLKKLNSELTKYVTSSRRSESSFENDVYTSIETLEELNYSIEDITQMIIVAPTILHLDKNDLFWRYLLFEKVIDTKTGNSIRDEAIIKHPQYFWTSQDILYARIKHLESEEGKSYRRNKEYLTLRQVIKNSNNEFNESYHITKEELLKEYPFDNKAKEEIMEWPENKEILNSIFEKGTAK